MPRIQFKTLERPTWVYRKTNQRFLWFLVVEVSWRFKQLQAARRSACSCYEPLQPWLLGRRSHSAVTMSSQNITWSRGNWDQAFIMTFEEFYRFFRNQLQNDPLVLFSHSPKRGSSCVLLQKVLQPAMIQRRTRSASTKVLATSKIYRSIVWLRKKVLCSVVSMFKPRKCKLERHTSLCTDTFPIFPPNHAVPYYVRLASKLIRKCSQVLFCPFSYGRLKRKLFADSETKFAKLAVEYCCFAIATPSYGGSSP